MRILFVISDMRYGGAAKQLTLLAPQLASDRFQTRVCVLGVETPWTQVLASAGVSVEALDWTRSLDAKPFWRLRQVIREFHPDIVHAWGVAAMRAVSPARISARLVVSEPLRGSTGRVAPNQVDRWLLRRAVRVAAANAAEAAHYR